jgi:hypothetical protein
MPRGIFEGLATLYSAHLSSPNRIQVRCAVIECDGVARGAIQWVAALEKRRVSDWQCCGLAPQAVKRRCALLSQHHSTGFDGTGHHAPPH